MRTLRYVLWGLVIVVSAAVAGVYVGTTVLAPERAASTSLAAAFARSDYDSAGGPFRLTNTRGETVTHEDLKGKPHALFFGFTHCPDVCPGALIEAAGWLDALGEDADKLTIAFVSVDPERDRPELLGQYVRAFDERIMGLTADTEDEIREVAQRYRIRFEKVPLQSGSYTINHTADTLLFDKNGDYAGFIAYLPPQVKQNEAVAARSQAQTLEVLRRLIGA
ncbi:MAG: SCO family protein [Pseudomonadota bacterium]